MPQLEKITIEPVPEGFTKLEGTSVEEVLEILAGEKIDKYLVFPWSMKAKDERAHTIILTRADYHQLIEEGIFGGVEFWGGGVSYAGLYREAKYGNGQVILSELTHLRLCVPAYAPEDHYFLEVNGLTLAEAMKPRNWKPPIR